jgi:NADH:ubiquinone oxidoreductase subunit F (NADH-binding)
VERTALLDSLGRLRRESGAITPGLSDELADALGIRRGEVADVVSSYAYLRVPPDATRVCTGPVCACFGGRADGHGTVATPCLGHCDLAPVSMEGDAVVPLVTHSADDGPSTGLGRADETLAGYEARGGLAALRAGLPPGRVLAELETSGLIGCGGAGFPTHRKWRAVLEYGGPRVVVVNADEGEPGTFKDRYLMELRPHLVLEGLLLAMRFAGAAEAIVYVREEYAESQRRLRAALDELRAAGLLDGLSVGIVAGAGSYVCGEETAMLESLEGRRGMPRLRPPFPAESGYLGRPTLIDNVETLAHVPAILREGGAWFAALGANGATGVRLWSVSGAVRRPGCYEAPNGITLRALVDDHAGGATEEIGAIVPGGAASGILPPAALDVPLTRASLREWGADVGSAAVQVFPASYPVLDLLETTLRFFAEESCQKCTPCRIGTRALVHVVREARQGVAAMPPRQLADWLEAMEQDSICGLGQTAPLPLRSALRHWPELLEALR